MTNSPSVLWDIVGFTMSGLNLIIADCTIVRAPYLTRNTLNNCSLDLALLGRVGSGLESNNSSDFLRHRHDRYGGCIGVILQALITFCSLRSQCRCSSGHGGIGR